MKKILLAIMAVLIGTISSYASTADDAKAFFNEYVRAANNYSNSIERMYSPNALITRQVIKPNGELVNVNTDTATYLNQLRISQNLAKVKKYKNFYSNITVNKVDKGYKINAIRQPSGDNDRLKMYQIVQLQPNGKWLIVEELMQTRQQIFLKYAK